MRLESGKAASLRNSACGAATFRFFFGFNRKGRKSFRKEGEDRSEIPLVSRHGATIARNFRV